MKIIKRAQVIKNLIVFVFLSIYYLYVVNTIIDGKGALNLSKLTEFLYSEKLVFVSGLLLAWAIFFIRHWSQRLFILFCSMIFISSFHKFIITENKLILLGSFFYVFVSFFLNLILRDELGSCIYNPGFYDNQINKVDKFNFEVIAKNLTGKEFKGFLTNWDSNSCFIYFNEKVSLASLKGELDIQVNYLGKSFFAKGIASTNFSKAVGVRLFSKNTTHGILHWEDFFAIITDRGITPSIKKAALV